MMKTLVVITLVVAAAAAQVPYGLVPPAATQYNNYGGPFAPEFYGPQQLRFRREPPATNEAMMNPMLTSQDHPPPPPQYQQQAYPNSLLTLDEMSRTPLFQEYLSLPLFRQWLPSYSFQQFVASPTFQQYWSNPVFQQFFREPQLFYKYVYPVFSPTQYAPEQRQESQFYPQQQMQVPRPINQVPVDDYLPRDLDYYPENSYYSSSPSIMYQRQVDNYGLAYDGKPVGPVMYPNQVESYGPAYGRQPVAPVVQQNQVDSYGPAYASQQMTPPFMQQNHVDSYGPAYGSQQMTPPFMQQNHMDNYGPVYERQPMAPAMQPNRVDSYGPAFGAQPAPPVMYHNQVDSYEPTYSPKAATPIVYLIRPEGYNPMNNWYNPLQNSVNTRRVEIPIRVLKVPGPRQQEQLDEQELVEKILKALFSPALDAELASEIQEGSDEKESEMTSIQMTPPKAEYPGMRDVEEKVEEEPMATIQDLTNPETEVTEEKTEEGPAETTDAKTEAPLIIEATTEKQEVSETVDLVRMITANKRFARFDKKPTKLAKKEKLIGAEEKLINDGYYKYDTVSPGEEIVVVKKRSDDAYQTVGGDGIHSIPLTRDERSWSTFGESSADVPQDFKGNDDDQTYSVAPKN